MNELKFYSLVNDTTFKYLFKKENVRSVFIKIIKYYTDIDLEEYRLIDNEMNSGNKYSDYRLDILLENKERNIIVNVEMNEKDSKYHEKKNTKYIERIVGNTYSKNKEVKVYQININNYYCSYDKERMTDNYMLRNEDNTNEIEGLKIYNIFIPKIVENACSEVDYMLKLFQAKSYEEMRKIAGNNKEMKILVDEIEKLNRDKYYGALYSEKESREYDQWYYRNEGMQEGIEKGEKNIIYKLLQEDIPYETISKITGITIEELENIKEENIDTDIDSINRDKYYGALYSEKESREYDQWYYRNEGMQEGIEKGLQEGIEKGKKESLKETAIKMLKDNVDIETIIKYTNLDKEEILKLK